MPGQPQATDFTEVVPMIGDTSLYLLSVQLDSGQNVPVAMHLTKDEAERRELAINQAMIEYRTKRNAYERRVSESFREEACADPGNYTG